MTFKNLKSIELSKVLKSILLWPVFVQEGFQLLLQIYVIPFKFGKIEVGEMYKFHFLGSIKEAKVVVSILSLDQFLDGNVVIITMVVSVGFLCKDLGFFLSLDPI